MKKDKKSFIIGAAILSISGIICKVLGAVYRIPLSNILGTEGMGCYQMAYPVYSMLIMASSAGIPVAVSKLVAERLAESDEAGAYDVFRVANISLIFIGAVCSLLLFVFSDMIAELMGLPGAALSMKILAPSVVMVAVVSGYRGYMQGHMLMGATAASQLTEQVVRMGAGLFFASAMIAAGASSGAGGAMVGVTLSEAAGLAVMVIYHKVRHPKPIREKRRRGRLALLKKIYKIALPVTIGACAIALISAIDSAMIIRILEDIGYTEAEASKAYGLLTGFVQPVINMPAVFTGAVAISIVPAVAGACAGDSSGSVASQSTLAFRLSMILSIPCAVMMFILAEPLMKLLYSSLKGEELDKAVYLLRMLSPTIVMMGASQICSGVLQGCGRTVMPVLATALGAVLKVFIGLWLIRIPNVNIAGAAIGTLICFALSAWIDISLCKKYAFMKVDIKDCLLLPAAASVAMGVTMFIVEGYVDGNMGTFLSLLAGILVYAIILLYSGGIRPEDMRLVPKGDRVTALLKKARIWR